MKPDAVICLISTRWPYNVITTQYAHKAYDLWFDKNGSLLDLDHWGMRIGGIEYLR